MRFSQSWWNPISIKQHQWSVAITGFQWNSFKSSKFYENPWNLSSINDISKASLRESTKIKEIIQIQSKTTNPWNYKHNSIKSNENPENSWTLMKYGVCWGGRSLPGGWSLPGGRQVWRGGWSLPGDGGLISRCIRTYKTPAPCSGELVGAYEVLEMTLWFTIPSA